jgi:hypothetical protein
MTSKQEYRIAYYAGLPETSQIGSEQRLVTV